MIDESKMSWGLRPFRKDALAAFGVRALIENKDISWVPGRSSTQGSDSDVAAICEWADKTALPKLRKRIRDGGIKPESNEVFRYGEKPMLLEASPNGSDGYIYISMYKLPLEA